MYYHLQLFFCVMGDFLTDWALLMIRGIIVIAWSLLLCHFSHSATALSLNRHHFDLRFGSSILFARSRCWHVFVIFVKGCRSCIDVVVWAVVLSVSRCCVTCQMLILNACQITS